MTSEQHAQRIAQLEFQLYKADFGMGMPRDYERVLQLRMMLEYARKEAALANIISDSIDSDYDEILL